MVALTDNQFTAANRRAVAISNTRPTPKETDSFVLKRKSDVTGKRYDEGWILKDKRPDFVARSQPKGRMSPEEIEERAAEWEADRADELQDFADQMSEEAAEGRRTLEDGTPIPADVDPDWFRKGYEAAELNTGIGKPKDSYSQLVKDSWRRGFKAYKDKQDPAKAVDEPGTIELHPAKWKYEGTGYHSAKARAVLDDGSLKIVEYEIVNYKRMGEVEEDTGWQLRNVDSDEWLQSFPSLKKAKAGAMEYIRQDIFPPDDDAAAAPEGELLVEPEDDRSTMLRKAMTEVEGRIPKGWDPWWTAEATRIRALIKDDGDLDAAESEINTFASMVDMELEDVAAEAPEAYVPTAGAMKIDSGLSRSNAEIEQLMKAGRPVGVSALMIQPDGPDRTMSVEMKKLLIKYVNDGGVLMIDTGEIGHFKKWLAAIEKDPEAGRTWPDFKQAIEEYRSIIGPIDEDKRANVYLVAPDRVGDYNMTYSLLNLHGKAMSSLMAQGATVIVPLQKGPDQDLASVAGAYSDLVPNWDRVIKGIPYNREAWSQDDVIKYLQEMQEEDRADLRIHLLGRGEEALDPLKAKVDELGITPLSITSDSLAKTASKRKTEGRKQIPDVLDVPIEARNTLRLFWRGRKPHMGPEDQVLLDLKLVKDDGKITEITAKGREFLDRTTPDPTAEDKQRLADLEETKQKRSDRQRELLAIEKTAGGKSKWKQLRDIAKRYGIKSRDSGTISSAVSAILDHEYDTSIWGLENLYWEFQDKRVFKKAQADLDAAGDTGVVMTFLHMGLLEQLDKALDTLRKGRNQMHKQDYDRISNRIFDLMDEVGDTELVDEAYATLSDSISDVIKSVEFLAAPAEPEQMTAIEELMAEADSLDSEIMRSAISMEHAETLTLNLMIIMDDLKQVQFQAVDDDMIASFKRRISEVRRDFNSAPDGAPIIEEELPEIQPEAQEGDNVINDSLRVFDDIFGQNDEPEYARRRTLSAAENATIIKAGVSLAKEYIRRGITTFKEFVEAIRSSAAQHWNRLKAHLHTMWLGARMDNPHVEEISRGSAREIIIEFDRPKKPKKKLPNKELIAKAGMNIEKLPNGGFAISGKTFDWKGIIKDAVLEATNDAQRARWDNSKKRWISPEDPTGALAELIRKAAPGIETGDERTSRPTGSVSQMERLRAARTAEDERADSRRDDDDLRGEVDRSTTDLLLRGLEFDIPENVVNDQIADVGLIVEANKKGQGMYLLANAAGSGKSFVLGGAIKELRAAGVKSFRYVTMNQDLITQLKRDLKAFGLHDVEFVTYSDLSLRRKKKIPIEEVDVTIFDESHNIKNRDTARGKLAQDMIADSKFTVFASATPFENPVEAKYLEPTGIFDQFGSFEEWAGMYGATLSEWTDYSGKVHLTARWTAGRTQDGIAARQWFFRNGLMSNRTVKLPEDMVDSTFRKVAVEKEWVDKYDHFSATMEELINGYYDENGKPTDEKERSQIAMWTINAQKRILESSKVAEGIKRAEHHLEEGRSIVMFVETKAERSIGRFRMLASKNNNDPAYSYPQIAQMMNEWRQEKAMALMERTKPPPPPFAGFIEQIARALYNANIDYDLESTSNQIIEHFGPTQTALYTGDAGSKASKNLEAWRNRERRILIATMAKGGTGLSLHDTEGTRPTAQININLPWKASQVDQVAGRTARYGLKTKAIIEWIFADNIDMDRGVLAPRVGRRMQDMGALVSGIESIAARALMEWNFSADGVFKIARQEAGEGPAQSDRTQQYEDAARRDRTLRKAGNTSGGFFATPFRLALFMARTIGVNGDSRILEPSAGTGHLLEYLPEGASVTAIEQRQDNFAKLKSIYGERFDETNLGQADFLEWAEQAKAEGKTFTHVIMNPPFERKKGVGAQDIAHVQAAYELLTDRGRLMSIMGEGAFFREYQQDAAFREWLDEVGATVFQLPDKSFGGVGTNVKTRLIVIDKGRWEGSGREDHEINSLEMLAAAEDMIPDINDEPMWAYSGFGPLFDMAEPGERYVQAEQSPLYQRRNAEQVGITPPAAAAAALQKDAVARRILAKDKKPKKGDRVGIRLNLNVLRKTGIATQAVHAGRKSEGYKQNKGWWGGEVLTYAQAVILKDAYFNVAQRAREDIAEGRAKSPMASVDGELVAIDEMNFDGVEVSFNPHRVHLFVDANNAPIRSAEEVTVDANNAPIRSAEEVTIYGHRAYLRGQIEYYTQATLPERAGGAPTAVVDPLFSVNTAAFKKWFGDGVLRDRNGNLFCIMAAGSWMSAALRSQYLKPILRDLTSGHTSRRSTS
jgi:hypothetical protein